MSAPIELNVRSVWQGKVGVHSKYYERALKDKLGLTIKCNDEYMFLTLEQVGNPHSRSKENFRDNFKQQYYYLVYYKWKPTLGQQKLL